MALSWRRAEHWRHVKLKESGRGDGWKEKGWKMLLALTLCSTLTAWSVVAERAEQESLCHRSQAW